MEVAGEPRRARADMAPHLSTRLAHCMIITTNVCQLLLMVLFLALMLVRLDGLDVPWGGVFAPLWASDAISLVAGAHEVYRLLRMESLEHMRRNLVIAQANRLKGTACTAVFKALVVWRLADESNNMSALLICVPFYVCALGRFVLHYLKEKVPAPEPTSPPKRPGTPVNPLHAFIVLVAIRVDGLNDLQWSSTFWPLWIVFGILAVTLVAAGCLGIGILVTGEPRENGQRALFFICCGVLLTVTVCGFAFAFNLTKRLDWVEGEAPVSNADIISPLIAAYGGILCFYLAFTFILPRVVDADIAAMSERMEEEEDQRDGVLEAVTQHLAPPFLVQQSSTLFAHVNTTMMRAFLAPTGASATDATPRADAPGGGALRRSATAAWDAGAPGAAPADAPSLAEEGQAGVKDWASDPLPVLSEYEALQSELGEWLRTQTSRQPNLAGPARIQVQLDAEGGVSEVVDVNLALTPVAGAPGAAAGVMDAQASGEAAAHVAEPGAAPTAGLPRAAAAPAEAARVESGRVAGAGAEEAPADAGAETAVMSLDDEAEDGAPSAPAAAAPASSGAVGGIEADPPSAAPADRLVTPSTGEHAETARTPASAAARAGSGPETITVAVERAGPAEAAGGAGGARVATGGEAQATHAIGARRPHPQAGGGAPVQVPPEIVSKLRRYAVLKRQIVERVVRSTLVDLNAPAGPAGQAGTAAAQAAAPAASVPAKGGHSEVAALPLAPPARGLAALRERHWRRAAAAAPAPVAVEMNESHHQGTQEPAPPPAPLAQDVDGGEASPGPPPSTQGVREGGDDSEAVLDAMCWICCEGPRDAVFLECGHGGVCIECAQRCFKKKGRLCPMCRQPVAQVVHIQPQGADYEGAHIVRVHEVDPQVLDGLVDLSAASAPAAAPATAAGGSRRSRLAFGRRAREARQPQ
mmetsp:Transcript_10214/g.27785  ORF Transcript_10214/g.27785 Transcript_10214/m.27785 type:complete len:925 (+) Transcript_10214:80-2854(+)